MIIKRIDLQNFRNYAKRTFEFTEGINLIVGDNAVGKTNILEAIYLLASGRSFRVKSVEREMITYGQEVTRIGGVITENGGILDKRLITECTEMKEENTELEIVLTTGEVGGEKTGKKKYLVEGVAKRGFDFLGNFRAVCFGPEDLELITDSPSLRRKYLDSVLVQVDREYARCLLAYEKGIRARNKLLEGIREELRGGMWEVGREVTVNSVSGIDGVKRSEGENYRRRLYFWDQLVVKNGEVLTRKRGEYIDFLNGGDKGDWVEKGNWGVNFSIEYDKSLISEERLKQYEREEVYSATTLVGPHRDDFVIQITNNTCNSGYSVNKSQITNYSKLSTNLLYKQTPNSSNKIQNGDSRDLAVYGSRGEQRLAILWLKLGELAYIEKETGDRPVLLLDDIFSELDEEHRELVLELVGKQQTIITTADGGVLGELKKAGKSEDINKIIIQ